MARAKRSCSGAPRVGGPAIARVQRSARVLARLDVWTALAERAVTRTLRSSHASHDAFALVARGCRHPVIERLCRARRSSPTTRASPRPSGWPLVTGPNMAGNRRHAQIGLSSCSRRSARSSLRRRRDRRCGPRSHPRRRERQPRARRDHLHGRDERDQRDPPQRHARSLVLLDEIGRGTSTYDGVAIAWAVTEHLHDQVPARRYSPPTTTSSCSCPSVCRTRGTTMSPCAKPATRVMSLHRLDPGGTDRSYGVHVAQLAGLPTGSCGAPVKCWQTRERTPGGARRARAAARRGQLALLVKAPPPDPMVD